MKIVYYEGNTRHYKFFPSSEIEKVGEWLQWLSPKSVYYVTGGKAAAIKPYLPECIEIPEFQAVCSGANYLVKEEHQHNGPFILVNIGTGTSLFYVNEENKEQQRLIGTGMGGGTIMGLGRLLSGRKSFGEIIRLAEEGDRSNVDLLVKDIYETESPPVSGHLTAGNFAGGFSGDVKVEDTLRAMINMVAENIILLATRAAEYEKTNTIVFSGSALSANEMLKSDLAQFQDIISYRPVFLRKEAYAGATGCLIG
ncbi:type II pantothenate kinase [Bacillus sp. AK031]